MSNTQKIVKTSELFINHDKLKDYHSLIIKSIKELEDEYQNNLCSEMFGVILSKITYLGFQYFNEVEEYMFQCNYPKIEVHRKEYLDYSTKVIDYNIDYQKIKNPVVIIDFLKKWWTNHKTIMGTDCEKYVNSLFLN